jgi:hypothetical protein
MQAIIVINWIVEIVTEVQSYHLKTRNYLFIL